jgi:hypothetical protein
MSVEEEVQEHAHSARDPFDRRVAAGMAIIAAVLAVVSVLGHLCATEEIVLQQRAADQWAFGQAKDTRHYESQVAIDTLGAIGGDKAAAAIQRYAANRDRYERETEENRRHAREFESERDERHAQAVRLHLGAVFLEIAIILASMAILTKRVPVWWSSVGSACIGAIIAITTLLIH